MGSQDPSNDWATSPSPLYGLNRYICNGKVRTLFFWEKQPTLTVMLPDLPINQWTKTMTRKLKKLAFQNRCWLLVLYTVCSFLIPQHATWRSRLESVKKITSCHQNQGRPSSWALSLLEGSGLCCTPSVSLPSEKEKWELSGLTVCGQNKCELMWCWHFKLEAL